MPRPITHPGEGDCIADVPALAKRAAAVDHDSEEPFDAEMDPEELV
jgi:hypothetical protein